MENFSIVPGYQPIPFPAPVWLLKLLVILGFYLHAIPMNVALTGGLISGLFLMTGNAKNHEYATRLGHTLAYSLPFFVSFAITMGIVPLLFLQLVYGPLFYTSSILMAVPWSLVILLLLVGYYSLYIYNYQRASLGNRASWVLIGASFLFMVIAFFFTNNMTLMLRPEKWAALYQDDPYGFNLNWGDPQLVPRYLHFVVAAGAVTSLSIGCFGVYWNHKEKNYGQWLIKTASMLFLSLTLLQFPIGAWFMLSLPRSILMQFMGQDPFSTSIFIAALLGDALALVAMLLANRKGESRPFIVGLISTLFVIALMVEMRHLVREAFAQPFLNPEAFAAEPQWILIGLFTASALVLAGYLVWLAKVVWQAFHPKGIEVEVT